MRLARVSERTIRRDITSGRLRVQRTRGGRLRIRLQDARSYRRPAFNDRGLVTVAAFAAATGSSIRTIRRYIKTGSLPVVRASARKLFISSRDVPSLVLSWLTRQQDTRPHEPEWLRIGDVARLSGKSMRQVHHDLAKGALGDVPGDVLAVRLPGARRALLRIRRSAVTRYIG